MLNSHVATMLLHLTTYFILLSLTSSKAISSQTVQPSQHSNATVTHQDLVSASKYPWVEPTPTSFPTGIPDTVSCSAIQVTSTSNRTLVLVFATATPPPHSWSYRVRHLVSQDNGRHWTTTQSYSSQDYEFVQRCTPYAHTATQGKHQWALVSSSMEAAWNGAGDTLLSSHDNGTTWETVYQGIDLREIHFLSAQEGWLLARDVWLRHTRDGGKTWTDVKSDKSVYGVEFVTSRYGYATWYDDDKIKPRRVFTPNGGRHWIVAEPPCTKGGTESRIAPTVLFAVCAPDRGAGAYWPLLRSSDGGQHWQAIGNEETGWYDMTGGADEAVGLFFLNAKQGWRLASLYQGTISQRLRQTTDGGKSWRTVTETVDLLSELEFDTPQHGVAWLVDPRSGVVEIPVVPPMKKPVPVETWDAGRTWHVIHRQSP